MPVMSIALPFSGLTFEQEMLRSAPCVASSASGSFFLGLLPGPSATISTFASYRLERALSKEPDKFGTGVVAGAAGPEAANNAAATSGFVPLLALGLPFSPVFVILLSALMIKGVTPGPLLVTQHPEIFCAWTNQETKGVDTVKSARVELMN